MRSNSSSQSCRIASQFAAPDRAEGERTGATSAESREVLSDG
jgi:hypothetical protein